MTGSENLPGWISIVTNLDCQIPILNDDLVKCRHHSDGMGPEYLALKNSILRLNTVIYEDWVLSVHDGATTR